MINAYQKGDETVEAVKIVDAIASILECTDFVVGQRHDYRMTDTNSGIIIKFPGGGLKAGYSDYIVKDAKGEFSVMRDDVFETMYNLDVKE